jgi:hypothetical protein
MSQLAVGVVLFVLQHALGCTDPSAENFSPLSGAACVPAIVLICDDPSAGNYMPPAGQRHCENAAAAT